MDYWTVKEKGAEWEQGLSQDSMTIEEMADIVIKGFGHCEDELCISRQACGEDSCACVRAIFPTPQHFEMYLAAKEYFDEELCKASFISLLSKGAVFRTKEK